MRKLVLLLLLSGFVSGQVPTEPVKGIRQNTPKVHALINARIVPEPGKEIKKGTIVVRDGVIEAVGSRVGVPDDARVWDLEGMTVYPGLIEPYAQIGLPKEPPKKVPASHWNSLVRPEFRVRDVYAPTDDELKGLRALGFTAALAVPKSGVFRGQASVVSLGTSDAAKAVIRADVTQHLAFEHQAKREYPRSLMGAIALIRQTFLDADWYRSAVAFDRKADDPELEYNVSLEQLSRSAAGLQPVVFESSGVLNHLRALKIAKEFGLKTWIRGSGDEYRELPRLIGSGATLLLPLDFPQKPPVASLDDELNIPLTALQHWEAAPTNPRQLHEAGVPFVLTSSVLKKREDFAKRLTKTIDEGLPAAIALAALTTRTAKLLGVSDELGSIEKGKRAHLVVTEGELFDPERVIRQVWIDGEPIDVEPKPEVDPRGEWDVLVEAEPDALRFTMSVSGKPGSLKGTLEQDSTKVTIQSISLDRNRLSVVIPGDSLGTKGMFRAVVEVHADRMVGSAVSPQGDRTGVTATRKPKKEKESKNGRSVERTIPATTYPLGAYGRAKPPDLVERILVRGATIWTCGAQGTIQGDLLIESGKVSAVGQNLKAPSGARVIDGVGKHVTPGLIDCHSHQGVEGGINEGTQAVSCEVRIQDVIYPWDVDIYRGLAGGLTVMNILHGSSNPMGGQNAVVKLRWGSPAVDLLVKDAKPGVKFALGENVKRSNWTDPTNRYPKTRMGVEQIIRDRLSAAREYQADWRDWERDKKKRPTPRRDLEMDALVEILEGERLVHCHSYRQDEILMLIRVADDFGFTIGTFQHVLEGYKVAEAIAAHGAGASAFSDWWAYKFEVFDAIPFNGALMHYAGVNVSFNSDSGELARRMNLEGAKAVKDGGVTEEEALKFVTLNPAIQLGIDHRVGSLEVGKDGDFVIWSGHPLSTYSICEQTWIEGRKHFSLEEDRTLRERDWKERQRLVQKVLRDDKGAPASADAAEGEGGKEPDPNADDSAGWYGAELENESCHYSVDTGRTR